jgi:hypothetical protein
MVTGFFLYYGIFRLREDIARVEGFDNEKEYDLWIWWVGGVRPVYSSGHGCSVVGLLCGSSRRGQGEPFGFDA